MNDSTDEISLDTFFDVLSQVERRRLLLSLLEAEPGSWVDVDTTDDDRAAALHHVHFPVLTEHGLVDVRRSEGRVRRGLRFAAIEPHLQFLDEHREALPGTVA